MKRKPSRDNHLPLVYVEWIDASYERGEISIPELDPLRLLYSVGWLVREDEASVSIAMEHCPEDGQFRDVTHIPRVTIARMTRIKFDG